MSDEARDRAIEAIRAIGGPAESMYCGLARMPSGDIGRIPTANIVLAARLLSGEVEADSEDRFTNAVDAIGHPYWSHALGRTLSLPADEYPPGAQVVVLVPKVTP